MGRWNPFLRSQNRSRMGCNNPRLLNNKLGAWASFTSLIVVKDLGINVWTSIWGIHATVMSPQSSARANLHQSSILGLPKSAIKYSWPCFSKNNIRIGRMLSIVTDSLQLVVAVLGASNTDFGKESAAQLLDLDQRWQCGHSLWLLISLMALNALSKFSRSTWATVSSTTPTPRL